MSGPIEIENKSQVRENIGKPANRQNSGNKNRYLQNLIGAISNYTGLPTSFISPYSDSNDALWAITQLCVKDGDHILVINPAHTNVVPADQYNQITVDYPDTDYPLGGEPKAILQKVNERTSLIYLANPDKFSGLGRTKDEIEYFLNHIGHSKLVVDEEYFEFYGISGAELVEDYNNLFIIRSLSPVLRLSGMSCSYIITNAENQSLLKQNDTVISLPALSMMAAETALRRPSIIKRRVDTVRENMAWLSTRLRSRSVATQSTPTEYLLLGVPNPEETERFLKNWGIDIIHIENAFSNQVQLALRIGDDKTSRSFIEAFDRIPKEISHNWTEKSTLTLRRGMEKTANPNGRLKIRQNDGGTWNGR
jgi:histidinol-phosphate/aromatic aminotransferase/cobyric acid decarboxylase-like protein